MKRERWRAASARSSAVELVPGARQRRAAAVCTAISCGNRADDARASRKAKPLRQCAGQRAAAHLHEERIRQRCRRRQKPRPFRRPACARPRRQPVLRSLHAERNGAGRYRRAKAPACKDRRSRSGAPLADDDAWRRVPAEPRFTADFGIGRNEHVERPVGGARDDRRRQRRIAAGGDGQPARAQAFAGGQLGASPARADRASPP